MEKIEKFFKDRILFTLHLDREMSEKYYMSKNVFKPEDYSIDFLKKKVKAFVIIYTAN